MKTLGLIKWLIDFIEAEASLTFQNKIYRQQNKRLNCTTLKDIFTIKTQ